MPTQRAMPAPWTRRSASSVQIQLAVLPVGHRAARFHRVVTGGLHDEGFVEHEIGLLEAGLEIAERPFLERFAHRHRRRSPSSSRNPRRSTSPSRPAGAQGCAPGAGGAAGAQTLPFAARWDRRAEGCRADRRRRAAARDRLGSLRSLRPRSPRPRRRPRESARRRRAARWSAPSRRRSDPAGRRR